MTVDPSWAPPPATEPITCYRHPGREAGIRCVRCDRPICSNCMVSAPVGFQCPECVREGAKSIRTPVSTFGGRAVANSPVTMTLIVINVVIFVLTAYTGHQLVIYGGNSSSLYQNFALISPDVAAGQYYRLFSSAFLHYGILHVASNMYCLFIIGPLVERSLGRWRYLVIYVLSGLGGSILTVLLASPNDQSAGASGAIFGLFGALFIVQRRMNVSVTPILATIGFNLVLSFAVPDISWEGHIGGLITGTAMAAAIVATAHQPKGRLVRHVAVFVGFAVVLSAVGLLSVHRVENECMQPQYYQFSATCTAINQDNSTAAPAPAVPPETGNFHRADFVVRS